MAGIIGFVVGAWNFVVSIAPTLLHTACELTNGAAKTITLGGS